MASMLIFILLLQMYNRYIKFMQKIIKFYLNMYFDIYIKFSKKKTKNKTKNKKTTTNLPTQKYLIELGEGKQR